MEDLVRWLGEQLDEDERAAGAATPGPWAWTPETDVWDQNGPTLIREGTDEPGAKLVEVAAGWGHDAWGMHIGDADQAHIAAHDPARVLREIEAKRKLARLHRPIRSPMPDGITNLDCSTCGGEDKLSPSWPCPSIRLLALPYADRAGYREEWRP